MNDIERWINEAPHSRGFCLIGKGKSSHFTRGNDETLCGKLMIADGSRYVSASDAADYKPCRTCWTKMERESAELEKVGTMAEVQNETAKVMERATLGKAKTVHVLQYDGAQTACGRDAKTNTHVVKPDTEVTCKKCATVAASFAPLPKAAEVPGLFSHTDDTTNTTGETDMAAKTMDKAAQTKADEEVRAGIERLTALITQGGDGESAEALTEELKTATNAITGTGAAAIKAKLRADMDKAIADALKAKPSADVAVKGESAPEVEDRTNTPEVRALVADGVEKVKKGVALGRSMGEVAEELTDTMIHIRVAMLNPHNLPDLTSRGKKTKDAAGEAYAIVLAELEKSGDEVGAATVNSLKRGVQNRMAGKLASWLGSLNDQVEFARETFPAIAEGEYADMEPEAAVRALYADADEKYKLPIMSRSELQTARKNGEEEGGEGKGEDEETDEGNELGEDATPAAKRASSYLSKAEEFFEKTEKKLSAPNVKKMTDDEKTAIKAKIDALIAEAAALGALLK
ncbi:hypothetical protein [Streptomyces sp. NPDC058092]|uniref:hypothetical protein n=1 Tax=Streptomyces sp. NPDC058092 TaxID=3346336 RepID=UPI0036E5B0BF